MGASEPEQTAGFIRSVGAVRDGLIIIGSISYVLGYVLWSYLAWSQDLGSLPVLDSQYFAAGLIPATFLGLAFFGYKNIAPLSIRMKRWILLNPQRASNQLFLCFLLSSGSITALLGFVFWTRNRPFMKPWVLMWTTVSLAVFVGILYTGSVFIASVERLPNKQTDTIDNAVRSSFKSRFVFMTTVFFALGLVALGTWWYSMLPGDLGGFQPRSVYLELERKSVPTPTQLELFRDASESSTDVVRSVKVDLFVSAGDYCTVVVKQSNKRSVHKIRKDIVKSIVWESNPHSVFGD